MPPLVIVSIITASAGIGWLGWLLIAPSSRTREQVLANAVGGLTATVSNADAQVRAKNPISSIAPKSIVDRLQRLSENAGRPEGYSLDKMIMAKFVLPVIMLVLGGTFYLSGPSGTRLILVAVVTLVAFFVPELLLKSKAQERQTTIGLELPDTLDQMTIAVGAGLGFEAAMMRAAKNGSGPLAEELLRTLQDMQLGRSRREAYHSLAERAAVPDLRRFLRAVIQADAYGVSISDALKTQASEMRLKRRQRAEEKAMKIPVKVLFPLMFCILPALFIVLLGPAIVDMVEIFGE